MEIWGEYNNNMQEFCSFCHGTGRDNLIRMDNSLAGNECEHCNGTGWVLNDES